MSTGEGADPQQVFEMVKHWIRKQRKRLKCGICGRKSFWWAYDGFELWLGLTKAEARKCEVCWSNLNGPLNR